VRSKDIQVNGFLASGIACGIKKTGKKDLALIVSETPAYVAGVFTKSTVKASTVVVDMKRERSGRSRGVVVNSGNANACTGERGMADTLRVIAATEKALAFNEGDLMMSSTGVIGVPLAVGKIEEALPRLAWNLKSNGWRDASQAIMTTDAFHKITCVKKNVGRTQVTIAAIAKGAGMICPNMATMLCFAATDANIKAKALKAALKEAVGKSFNRISVDNDTSTNDTVLVFANGAAKGPEIKTGTAAFKSFTAALSEALLRLAHLIVRDGEGATRFVELTVKGASNDKQAETAARRLAGSLLVKTALFGGDPNWGRIMAAIGTTNVKFDQSDVDILLGGVKVFSKGVDTGEEKRAAKAMKRNEVSVVVDLKRGKGAFTLWTTDLNYDYVRINSSYRT